MKKNLKSILTLCLTLALVFSLAACGQKAEETPDGAQDDQQTEQTEFSPASYSIAALKGPTAMGLVKLMQDSAPSRCCSTSSLTSPSPPSIPCRLSTVWLPIPLSRI